MNSRQCKMARAGLGLSLIKLAELSNVSVNTINRFEKGNDSYASTAKKLREAFESTGQVKFEGESCVCVVSDSD